MSDLFDVFQDEDGFYYSEGIVAENGDYYTIDFKDGSQKWALIFPYDLCTLACSKIGTVNVNQ